MRLHAFLYVEAAVIIAAIAHELGHYLVCKLLGAKTYGVRVRLLPIPAIGIARDLTHVPLKDAAISAAGVVANFSMGLCLWHYGLPVAAFWSLLMGTMSLIPIGQQDGVRIVASIRLHFAGPCFSQNSQS